METENSSNKKIFFKNVLYVIISNAFNVLSGILVGFLVPKMMGVSDYGYYKTFTLYASYIGIFHFGFIDGIYLYYAGKKQEELEKSQFRTFFKFLLLMQLCVSLIFTFISLIFVGTEYFFIFLFIGFNIVAVNVTTYYEFITQITMRFRLLSLRGLIRSSLTIVSVVILFLMYRFNYTAITYILYISIVLGINCIMAVWYIFTYRDLTFGKSTGIKLEKANVITFFKAGIPLLCANLIAQLVFVVDQQFVNIFFDIDTYSTYAFAYTMINLITVATGAISTVLYPTLKKMNPETVKSKYSTINKYLLMFVLLCLLAYYPLDLIVRNFLEEYISALDTFRIILPGIVISSSISVVKYNCYKNFNQINRYFIKSIIILFISISADLCVYFIFKNTISISIVSIFVLLIWYFVVEFYFIKKYKVKWKSNALYMVILILAFYATTFISNVYLAGVAYFLCYLLITIIFNYRIIRNLMLKRLSKVR